MGRPITLFTGPWTDLALEDVARKAGEFGYEGLEIACFGEHLDVRQAASSQDYSAGLRDLLDRYDLQCHTVTNYPAGQAVCDRADPRLQDVLPAEIWGDGEPQGVSRRAAEGMKDTARAAQKLGVEVVVGYSGSSLGLHACGYPPVSAAMVEQAFEVFAERWNPILDVYGECGVKFALEVHPGSIAFDLYTARRALAALGDREEFGFNLDPSQLHWQGVDPVEFVREFPDRIFHVHVKDVAITLNGRSGILSSGFPVGDPRRGWDFRAPGRGGVNFEELIRALNQIGYAGPLSVDWEDPGFDREQGAREACEFARRLDFTPTAGPRALAPTGEQD